MARGPVSPAVESVFRPALALMSGRAIGFAFSFLIPVALARVLDQADFGTYKQLFLVAATLGGVGQLGMAESLFYFLPRAGGATARYVANAAIALALGGLACLAAIGLGGDALSRWLGNAALERHTVALGLYVCLMIMSATLEIVMTVRKRYTLAAWTYAGLDITRAALLVVPVLLAPGLSTLLAGAVVFAAIRCGLTFWYMGRELGGTLRPDRALSRVQLAYAMPFALAGLVEIAQSNFHQYFVAYHFDAATFAIYAVGCLQIPLVEVATASVLNITMVRMSEELAAGRAPAASAVWHDSTRKLALMFIPLVGLLMTIAHPLIAVLFTERYAASVPVLMVSSLSLLLPALAVDAVLRVHAETRVLFGLNLIRLAVTVALIGPLVASLGLVGAALATVLAAVVAKGIGLARIGAVMGLPRRRLLPWRDLALIVVAAAAAGAVAALVRGLVEAPALVELAVTSAAYGAAYLGALWGLGVLTRHERNVITSWLRRGAHARPDGRPALRRNWTGGKDEPCVESQES